MNDERETMNDEPRTTPDARRPTDDKENHTGHVDLSRVVSIPNILSISRLFLLPAILLLLQARQTGPALTLMAISWLSDALDGYFARRLNQVTNLGKILDHLVDKIWVGTVLVMLVATRGLPVFIAAAVIARDLLIVTGSFLIMDTRRKIVSSNTIGKITGTSFALLMLLYVIDNGYEVLRLPKLIALYVVVALVVISFANYVIVYLRTMRRKGEE
jgi:CDP-diacylglycerol--glycerol-3-phosphate 3-phosphatidyltransferase